MKSPARYLYVVADIFGPNGLAAFCTVVFAALMIGLLRMRELARIITRRGVALFRGGGDDPTTLEQGT